MLKEICPTDGILCTFPLCTLSHPQKKMFPTISHCSTDQLCDVQLCPGAPPRKAIWTPSLEHAALLLIHTTPKRRYLQRAVVPRFTQPSHCRDISQSIGRSKQASFLPAKRIPIRDNATCGTCNDSLGVQSVQLTYDVHNNMHNSLPVDTERHVGPMKNMHDS